MNATSVGQWLQLKTADQQTILGQLYAYDIKTQSIILHTVANPSAPISLQKLNFIILKPSFVVEVTQIQPPLNSGSAVVPDKPVGKINLDKLQTRERNAVRAFEENLTRIGVGVSAEAQAIFDTLAKTLPCRWENDVIVVMEEVRISPPYRLTDCQGSQQASLQHVRKILERLLGNK